MKKSGGGGDLPICSISINTMRRAVMVQWHGKTEIYLQTVIKQEECDMFSPITGFVSQSDGLHPVNQTPMWRQQIGLQAHTNIPTTFSNLQPFQLINYKLLMCRILFNQSERQINMQCFLQIPQNAVSGSDSVASMLLQIPWTTKATLIQEKHSNLQAIIGLAALCLAQLFWGEYDRRKHELTRSHPFRIERKFQTAWLHLSPQGEDEQQPAQYSVTLSHLLLK